MLTLICFTAFKKERLFNRMYVNDVIEASYDNKSPAFLQKLHEVEWKLVEHDPLVIYKKPRKNSPLVHNDSPRDSRQFVENLGVKNSIFRHRSASLAEWQIRDENVNRLGAKRQESHVPAENRHEQLTMSGERRMRRSGR